MWRLVAPSPEEHGVGESHFKNSLTFHMQFLQPTSTPQPQFIVKERILGHGLPFSWRLWFCAPIMAFFADAKNIPH